MDRLARYRKMRDFALTAEPAGAHGDEAKASAQSADPQALRYVIQQHAASRLHYDFRLELNGVLLSWAVPKGPSFDPGVKRLAVETEPHPLEYGDFEGVIPQGQYGGGTVMIWDHGTWEPSGDAERDYQRGRLSFNLHGKKLHGSWHLVRTGGARKKDGNWLLFKGKDEFAETGKAEIPDHDRSSKSGLTMARIAEENAPPATKTAAQTKAEGKPKAKSKPTTKGKARRKAASEPDESEPAPESELANLAGAQVSAAPTRLEPELATLVDEAPTGDDWLNEVKFDGYRLLARLEGGNATLFTRNGLDWTAKLGPLATELSKLKVREAWLDGELVSLNAQGQSSFQSLQHALGDAQLSADLVYYAFDLLHRDGFDLRNVPLTARKTELRRLVTTAASSTVRYSEHVVGKGADFIEQARALGLEGMIAKRASSTYRAGRGRDWLKIKCSARQEFIVVGFSEPAGSRSHFGALLLAVCEGGELRYTGRVGTGFDQASLRDLALRMAPLEIQQSALPAPPRGAAARGVHWLRPELVAEVAFTGFTDDGVVRHPTFKGLREDKPARDVAREKAATSGKSPAAPPAPVTARGRAQVSAPFPITNPDKILYPGPDITKRELLDYYASVADRMLPHVKNRPLTLVRCPHGCGKPCFFQKHPGKGAPEALRTVAIRESDGKAPYAVLDNEQGLFSLVQLGALEVHTWGSAADDFERPNLLVFDLDPDEGLDFGAVIRAAQRLQKLFASAKLESWVKTTGGKGLHVCVPIAPHYDWPVIKGFCKQIADELAREAPDLYVATQTKAQRKGKIYIDYLRNARGATFIAPYSTRAREGASVAVPLEWDELTAKLDPAKFTVRTLGERLVKLARDPFSTLARSKQELPAL